MRKAISRNVIEYARRQDLNPCEHQRNGFDFGNARAGIRHGGFYGDRLRESGKARNPPALINLDYAEMFARSILFQHERCYGVAFAVLTDCGAEVNVRDYLSVDYYE